MTDVLSAILEATPLGIIVLDHSGRITLANRAARALLRDQVIMADGSRLEHFVTYRSPRPAIERITCGTATGHAVFEPSDAGTMVFLSCSTCAVELLDRALQSLYQLTSQERRLTALLYGGLSLGEAAQAVGIEPSTARTHLKSIFAKTQTRRQAQLVRLVASCAAALGFPSQGERDVSLGPVAPPFGLDKARGG